MSQITKIDHNSKLEDLREKAKALYRNGSFEETVRILSTCSKRDLDSDLVHLLGKAAHHLGNLSLARSCYEEVFLSRSEDEELLRNLIDLYDDLKEYRKLLHYSNLLFGLQTDHTHDILRVLQLYRRLGLYGRAVDLFDTLEQSGYNAELFADEKALLHLETGNYQQVHDLFHPQASPSSLSPELEKRARREVRLGPGSDSGWNLKALYYRHYGKVLLGSYSDDGNSADIYDSFIFDEDHFYETCLRFVDFVQDSQIRYASISPANPSESVVPRVLSKILSIPFQKEPPMEPGNSLHLIIHTSFFQWKPMQESSAFHHFSFGFSFMEALDTHYPEYAGVFLMKLPPRFFFDPRATKAKELSEEIFQSMRSKVHISSTGHSGRHYFSGLPEFASIRSHVIRLPAQLGTRALDNLGLSEKFSRIEASLRRDGPLYLKSLLQSLKGLSLSSKQVKSLLGFHRQWGYPPCALPGYCAFHDLDQTFHFYETEWIRNHKNPEMIWVFSQIPHQGVAKLLLPLLDSKGKEREPFLISGAWILLQYHKDFSTWLESMIRDPETLPSIFQHLFLLESWEPSWIEGIQKNFPLLKPMEQESMLDEFQERKIVCSNEILENWAQNISEPSLSLLILLSKAGFKFPAHLETWLRKKRMEPIFAQVLNLFDEDSIFKKEWDEQKKSTTKLHYSFAGLHLETYRVHADEMQRIFPEAGRELQNEILSYFLHNGLFEDFCFSEIARDPEKKEILGGWILQFLEGNKPSLQDRDLLFLMEGDELQRFRCARFFLSHSDMEFYTYITHRIKTHALLLGAEGLKTLFELRSDQAFRLIVEYALTEQGCSPHQIGEFFRWISNDSFLLDEWLLLLSSRELKVQREALQSWMLSHLELMPSMLLEYVRFFPKDTLKDIINLHWNAYSDLSEKVEVLRSLDPSLIELFYSRVHPKHFQFHILEKICASKKN